MNVLLLGILGFSLPSAILSLLLRGAIEQWRAERREWELYRDRLDFIEGMSR